MSTKIDPMDKAIAALTAYGYVLQGDEYIRSMKQTQRWQLVKGGFFRRDDPGAVSTPHHCIEPQNGLSYLNPEHRKFFEWIWPAEEIIRIYGR